MPIEPGTKLHTRNYAVDAMTLDDEHFQLTGRVSDDKPMGLGIVEGEDPVRIHDMTVVLTIHIETFVITAVDVQMHTHPEVECPGILASYQQLVGLSIARGFTQKVRELFGGPRACTHIGALINAMAPVAMQARWGLFNLARAEEAAADVVPDPQARRLAMERNRNTCHVFASDGPIFRDLEAGIDRPPPLWAIERMAQLGVDDDSWWTRR